MKCSACKAVKPLGSFPKDRRNLSGRKGRCKICEHKRLRKIVTSTPLAGFRNRLQQTRRRGKFPVKISARYLLSLWAAQDGRCALSGIRMAWRTGKKELTSISIDRLNNKKGYEEGNIRLICFGLNCLRNDHTDAEALALAKAFVEYTEEKVHG